MAAELKKLVLLASVAGAICACSSREEVETQYYVYSFPAGQDPPCSESLAWLDELTYQYSQLLLDAPPAKKFSYVLFDNDVAPCSHGGDCAYRGEIRSSFTVYPHEVVHVVAFELGDPPQFFAEGLAEMLTCYSGALRTGLPVDKTLPIGSYLQQERWEASDDLRRVAAAFNRFLIDQFSWSAYREFYARTPRDADQETLDSLAEASFGKNFAELIDNFKASPPRAEDSYCWYVGERVSKEVLESTCERAFSSPFAIPLTLDGPTRYRFNVSDVTTMALYRQDGQSAFYGEEAGPGSLDVIVDASAGNYVLHLSTGGTVSYEGAIPFTQLACDEELSPPLGDYAAWVIERDLESLPLLLPAESTVSSRISLSYDVGRWFGPNSVERCTCSAGCLRTNLRDNGTWSTSKPEVVRMSHEAPLGPAPPSPFSSFPASPANGEFLALFVKRD